MHTGNTTVSTAPSALSAAPPSMSAPGTRAVAMYVPVQGWSGTSASSGLYPAVPASQPVYTSPYAVQQTGLSDSYPADKVVYQTPQSHLSYQVSYVHSADPYVVQAQSQSAQHLRYHQTGYAVATPETPPAQYYAWQQQAVHPADQTASQSAAGYVHYVDPYAMQHAPALAQPSLGYPHMQQPHYLVQHHAPAPYAPVQYEARVSATPAVGAPAVSTVPLDTGTKAPEAALLHPPPPAASLNAQSDTLKSGGAAGPVQTSLAPNWLSLTPDTTFLTSEDGTMQSPAQNPQAFGLPTAAELYQESGLAPRPDQFVNMLIVRNERLRHWNAFYYQTIQELTAKLAAATQAAPANVSNDAGVQDSERAAAAETVADACKPTEAAVAAGSPKRQTSPRPQPIRSPLLNPDAAQRLISPRSALPSPIALSSTLMSSAVRPETEAKPEPSVLSQKGETSALPPKQPAPLSDDASPAASTEQIFGEDAEPNRLKRKRNGNMTPTSRESINATQLVIKAADAAAASNADGSQPPSPRAASLRTPWVPDNSESTSLDSSLNERPRPEHPFYPHAARRTSS